MHNAGKQLTRSGSPSRPFHLGRYVYESAPPHHASGGRFTLKSGRLHACCIEAMRLAGDVTSNISIGGGIATSTFGEGPAVTGTNTSAGPEEACGEKGGRSLVLWVGIKFRAIARSHLEFYAMLKTPKNAKEHPAAAAAADHQHGQPSGRLR